MCEPTTRNVDEECLSAELDARLGAIVLAPVEEIRMISSLDIEIRLTSGVSVHFLGVASDDDELFHVFCPDKVYLEYSVASGWKIGKSDQPWKAPCVK
jgi:hypothetical protein